MFLQWKSVHFTLHQPQVNDSFIFILMPSGTGLLMVESANSLFQADQGLPAVQTKPTNPYILSDVMLLMATRLSFF